MKYKMKEIEENRIFNRSKFKLSNIVSISIQQLYTTLCRQPAFYKIFKI